LVGVAVITLVGVTQTSDGSAPDPDATETTVLEEGPVEGSPIGQSAPDDLPYALPVASTALDVPILMYHYVDDEPPPAGPYADGLTVRTGEFRDQMDYLARKGYRVVDLRAVYYSLAGGPPLPAKPVVLTFDDGGEDNYTVAYPILRDHGYVATFFVITGKVGSEGAMTWQELRELQGSGMSVQSHTVSHPDLRGLDADALAAELEQSRAAVRTETGSPADVLCYPSGEYDADVIAAAREAGFRLAVTTEPGTAFDPAHPLELPRVRIPAHLPLSSFAELLR
jgi:peptidoglycan/xylan/chitin deacetylase (PgdA/CDA1 family)